MALAISLIRSEPDGILYSNSIVAWIFHLLSLSRRSTSPIGVSPSPKGVLGLASWIGARAAIRKFACRKSFEGV